MIRDNRAREPKKTTRSEAIAKAFDQDIIVLADYDPCVIGVLYPFSEQPSVAYDVQLMVRELVLGGLTRKQAEEYVEAEIYTEAPPSSAGGPTLIMPLSGLLIED